MGVCLLLSFLLFRTRYVIYLMAFWCKFFMRVLRFDFGMFKLVSFVVESSYMTLLTLVVMVMRGLVLHPLFCIVLISRLYLVLFCVRDIM